MIPHPDAIWTGARGRLIVSGAIHAGKSTWCAALIAHARDAGARVAGVLSPRLDPAAPDRGKAVVDLATGARRILLTPRDADAIPDADTILTPRWRIDAAALAWGEERLHAALTITPAPDLIVIDELGIVEFERGAGWQSGIALLDAARARLTVATVRESLLTTVRARWADAGVILLPSTAD